MTFKTALIPVGTLAVVLSVGVFQAEAGQDRGRERHGDRGSSQAQPRRDGGGRQQGAEARPRNGGREQRGGEARVQREQRPEPRAEVRTQRDYRPQGRADVRAWRGDGRERQRDDRVWRSERRNGGIYAPPRVVSPRYVYPGRSPYRHYGPGPGLSVFFGIGSGYRYGSPYYGRVYGYSVPSVDYGVRRYYGDVRLDISPREAAVYVDGYYAGIVDDFDGVLQRLTLEAGPHKIEVELPGFETRAFDVLVDPTRTIDLHDELLPERP
jgi:hypothetical protein